MTDIYAIEQKPAPPIFDSNLELLLDILAGKTTQVGGTIEEWVLHKFDEIAQFLGFVAALIEFYDGTGRLAPIAKQLAEKRNKLSSLSDPEVSALRFAIARMLDDAGAAGQGLAAGTELLWLLWKFMLCRYTVPELVGLIQALDSVFARSD